MHQPLPLDRAYTITAHERQVPAELAAATDSNGVAAKGQALSRWRTKLSEFYFGDVVNAPTVAELTAAHEHEVEHAAVDPTGVGPHEIESAEDIRAREERNTAVTT
jgi:ubiquinol-cytochrome c reductase cytochrome b subunit